MSETGCPPWHEGEPSPLLRTLGKRLNFPKAGRFWPADSGRLKLHHHFFHDSWTCSTILHLSVFLSFHDYASQFPKISFSPLYLLDVCVCLCVSVSLPLCIYVCRCVCVCLCAHTCKHRERHIILVLRGNFNISVSYPMIKIFEFKRRNTGRQTVKYVKCPFNS